MNARSLAWLGALTVLPAGCFNPGDGTPIEGSSDSGGSGRDDPDSTGAADSVDPGGSTVTAATTTSTTPASTSAATSPGDDTSTGSTTGDDDGADSSSSGLEPVIECSDGVVVEGEVCFEVLVEQGGRLYAFGLLEDIDGDGDRDLIYSATNGELAVQFNGDGQFGLETTSNFAGVGSLNTMGPLDFDDDGVRDGVLVSQAGGAFYSTRGNPSGDYTITDSAFTEAYDVAIGDMNGDGAEEAVMLVLAGLQVWSVDGDGQLMMLEGIMFGDFGTPRAVELADFNSDGQLDVIYLGAYGDPAEDGQVRIQLGNGDGTLGGIELYPVVSTSDARDLALGDFDGDGEVDVAVADGATVAVVFGNGALAFSPSDEPVVASGLATQIEAADVDLDGVDDLIVGYEDHEELTVYLGAAARVFAEGQPVALSHPTESLSTGDINDDGVPDVVVTSRSASALSVLHSIP